MSHPDKVVILDFGSQYTQLIARRVREAGVYSEIHPCTISPEALRALDPKALILSGGPSSVTDPDAPPFAAEIFDWGLPMQSGVNLPALSRLLDLTALPVVAAGGVATLDDVKAVLPLAGRGLEGVISGRAIYAGTLDFAAALALIASETREVQ